jgi:hypothetical protein
MPAKMKRRLLTCTVLLIFIGLCDLGIFFSLGYTGYG